ncbi:MAG: Gfo/Idh/MocA family oxidoreductase [Chlorobi bacterium]|nr:Gfo/Idh/MocA family oxidoreductase [Chlorobiota bacterium]
MDKKFIAVVGAGHWGKNHVRNFYELGCLSIVCDTNPGTLNNIQKNYPGVKTTLTYREVLEDPGIKGIVIASNAETHFQLASEALEYDKDVLVEKPLALNVSDAKKLHKLATEKSRILMVGHLLLFHPAIRKIKEYIQKGVLGKVLYIYSNRLNLGKVRQEENILWSFAPHDISVILELLGESPVEVQAMGEAYLQPNIQDVTMTVMKFKSGAMAHIHVSWLHPFKEHRLVVIGNKKMIVFNDTAIENKLLLYDQRVDIVDGAPKVVRSAGSPVSFSNEEPLRKECLHFIECIEHRRQPKTDGQNGIEVLQVLETAQKSLEKKNPAKMDNSPYFVHDTAVVDEGCEIGKGTKIWHFSHIQSGSKIGSNCSIGQNVYVANNVRIGNQVKIQNNVSVYEGVVLEDYVFCGPSMVFTNINRPRSEFPQRGSQFYERTLVKKSASIGANATIICGVTIGEYAFIGAGAVVTKDVPAHALVVGNPGRIIGWVDKKGRRLEFDKSGISICGRFKLKDQTLTPLSKD